MKAPRNFKFKDRLLHKLEVLHQATSAPNRTWHIGRYAKFHSAIEKGLEIKEAKKLNEAIHLVLFAIAYPHFPDGKVRPGEGPDFTVEIGDHLIGIEHCRVFVSAFANLHQRAKNRSRTESWTKHKRHQEARRQPVMISCSFNNETHYKKADIDAFSQRLARCIPPSLSTQPAWTILESHDCGPEWLPGLALIQGRAPQVYEPPEGRWHASHGGGVLPSEPYIQTRLIVSKKN